MAARRRRRSPLVIQRERTERAELKVKELLYTKRAEALRAYEAATPSSYYPRRGDNRSGDAVIDIERGTMRAWARFLDENHDLAIGVLDEIVNKVVGRGITVEPCALGPSGQPAERFNTAARDLYREFTQAKIETTRELPWHGIERLVCRTLMRDGEVLIGHVEGRAAIKHRGPVPYSIELLEADFLPFHLFKADQTVGDNRVIHGVEKNGWREAVAYHLLKEHPGDVGFSGLLPYRSQLDTKRVPARQVTHLKNVHRLGQTRGITIFHGILQRLEDLKQYDESERIAARVAAAFTAIITRTPEYDGPVNADAAANRLLEMSPGMIFDDMLPGEDVKTIGSDRPSSQYDPFIKSGLRRVAAGAGTVFSTIARDFNGTFSSQRQEMVEGDLTYSGPRGYFIDRFEREIYERFIDMAILSGRLPLAGVDLNTVHGATYTVTPMPWIDPLKEAQAAVMLIDSGLKSRHQTIRERGGDPLLVDAEIARDTFAKAVPAGGAAGSSAGSGSEPAAPAADDDDDTDDDTDQEAQANA